MPADRRGGEGRVRLKKMVWIAAVLAIVAIIAGLLYFTAHGRQAPMNGNNSPVSYFCYSNSGSSTYEIYSYEVEKDEESGKMTVNYELNCGNLMYSVPADEELMQALSAVIADKNMRKWNGFKKTNSMVLDGSGFSLSIAFEDGSMIKASGSNSFPEGFGDAKAAIDELFEKYLEKKGIELD